MASGSGSLEDLLGGLLGGGQSPGGASAAPTGQASGGIPPWLMPIIMSLIGAMVNKATSGGGNAGGAGAGGLGDLLDKFRAAGQGEAADSWVSTGPNQGIDPAAIEAALGSDEVAQAAAAAGVSSSDVSEQLSKVLPGFVDGLTPQGELPSQGTLADLLAQFGRAR